MRCMYPDNWCWECVNKKECDIAKELDVVKEDELNKPNRRNAEEGKQL